MSEQIDSFDLDDVVTHEGFGEIHSQAAVDLVKADIKVRRYMTGVISILFVSLNAAVIFLIWKAINTDTTLLKSENLEKYNRLITEKVFMSLIGATVVQVGITLAAITGYLFPKREKEDGGPPHSALNPGTPQSEHPLTLS